MSTIYKVAEEAGVSPKTAARVLSGMKARPRNQERVLAAARKLGYVRNQQAANLRSGKSGLIGLVVPDITNPYYPALFQTIHDIAFQRGYQILLSSVFGEPAETVRALQMMEINRVEGLIFNGSEKDYPECDEILQRFLDRDQPVILGGRPVRNLKADEIIIKNVGAVEKATDYLIKTGHEKIAFISGPLSALGNRERLEGFTKAMNRNGYRVPESWICEGMNDGQTGQDLGNILLSARRRPSGIICGNDQIAIGVLKAANALHLRVPSEIAIVGFDDIQLARLVTPSLTTLRQPQNRIARDVINLLIERINSGDVSDPRKLVYEPELIVRESA